MKYQALIKKIQTLKAGQPYFETNWNFNRSELELIEDALETIQASETILKQGIYKNMNKELRKIDQLPKYRPKNCWSCDQNQEENLNTLCDFHIKYSYERILREERQDLKDRNKWRIILGIFTVLLFSILVLVWTIFELKESAELFGLSLVYLLQMIWLIWRNEKDSQKWLAEHKKDKAEWIRN